MPNCGICNLSFHTAAERNNHIATSRYHPQCVSCDRRFLDEDARRAHYIHSPRHHGCFCSSCDRLFVDHRALEQHTANSVFHRHGVQSYITGPSSAYTFTMPDLRSVSDDGESDPSELWASDSDMDAQSDDERIALANAIATMTISPAMRQEAMQGYPVWSRSENGSYDDSDSDSGDDEIEGYNSEDFDSEDSDGELPALCDVGPNNRPLGYNRGQALDTKNNAPSSSSSSSTLNSDGSGALTKYENSASKEKTSPNSFIVYTCPLCMEEGGDLSSLACGHVFCSTCSKRALHHKRECPLCRQPARMRDVRRIYLAC